MAEGNHGAGGARLLLIMISAPEVVSSTPTAMMLLLVAILVVATSHSLVLRALVACRSAAATAWVVVVVPVAVAPPRAVVVFDVCRRPLLVAQGSTAVVAVLYLERERPVPPVGRQNRVANWVASSLKILPKFRAVQVVSCDSWAFLPSFKPIQSNHQNQSNQKR